MSKGMHMPTSITHALILCCSGGILLGLGSFAAFILPSIKYAIDRSYLDEYGYPTIFKIPSSSYQLILILTVAGFVLFLVGVYLVYRGYLVYRNNRA